MAAASARSPARAFSPSTVHRWALRVAPGAPHREKPEAYCVWHDKRDERRKDRKISFRNSDSKTRRDYINLCEGLIGWHGGASFWWRFHRIEKPLPNSHYLIFELPVAERGATTTTTAATTAVHSSLLTPVCELQLRASLAAIYSLSISTRWSTPTGARVKPRIVSAQRAAAVAREG